MNNNFCYYIALKTYSVEILKLINNGNSNNKSENLYKICLKYLNKFKKSIPKV